jgi:hypothetical protein
MKVHLAMFDAAILKTVEVCRKEILQVMILDNRPIRQVREELKQAKLLRDKLETKVAAIFKKKRWMFEERFLGIGFSQDTPFAQPNFWRLQYLSASPSCGAHYDSEPLADTLGEELLLTELRLAQNRALRNLGMPIKEK